MNYSGSYYLNNIGYKRTKTFIKNFCKIHNISYHIFDYGKSEGMHCIIVECYDISENQYNLITWFTDNIVGKAKNGLC